MRSLKHESGRDFRRVQFVSSCFLTTGFRKFVFPYSRGPQPINLPRMLPFKHHWRVFMSQITCMKLSYSLSFADLDDLAVLLWLISTRLLLTASTSCISMPPNPYRRSSANYVFETVRGTKGFLPAFGPLTLSDDWVKECACSYLHQYQYMHIRVLKTEWYCRVWIAAVDVPLTIAFYWTCHVFSSILLKNPTTLRTRFWITSSLALSKL